MQTFAVAVESILQPGALPVDGQNMREEVHYDGIDLGRIAPFAWAATFGLGIVLNQLAGTGMSFADIKLQSVTVLILFIGLLALGGTAQAIQRFRDAGRNGPAIALTVLTVLLSSGIMAYGIGSYYSFL